MNYKNINIKELGFKQKIQTVASRVAFFVPRLLSKIVKKLIVSPINKGISGLSYDATKTIVQQAVMEHQNEQANEMQAKIDEGKKNLGEWRDDKEYYIGNLAKYKSYQSTVDDLINKQNRLRRSPKKILIAKSYLGFMKDQIKKRKERRAQDKFLKKLIKENNARKKMIEDKKQDIENKKQEIADLIKSLPDDEQDLIKEQQEYDAFYAQNEVIISQLQEEPVIDDITAEQNDVNEQQPVSQQEVQQQPIFTGTPTVGGIAVSLNDKGETVTPNGIILPGGILTDDKSMKTTTPKSVEPMNYAAQPAQEEVPMVTAEQLSPKDADILAQMKNFATSGQTIDVNYTDITSGEKTR